MTKSKLPVAVAFILDNFFDLATLVVASGIAIWHQIRPFDMSAMSSWILATLALLAISGIWDRNRRLRRMETAVTETKDLLSTRLLGPVRAASFFGQGPVHQELEAALSSASTIYICGLTLARTTRQFMDVFSRKLASGAKIRLAFLDPKDPHLMEILARRSMGVTTAEYWRTRLSTVADVISAIPARGNSAGSLQIGYLSFPPSFGLIFVDPEEDQGKCFVEIYHHRTAERNASFHVSARDDPYWYRFFLNQWHEAWKLGRVIDVAS